MKTTRGEALGPEDFGAFFKALHGHDPFHWQQALARRVLESLTDGHGNRTTAEDVGWPRTIEMPTATGKTAVLDIAVFAMACDTSQPRRAPRRCFFVVDRRIVVDSAYERARHIAIQLARASDGVLGVVTNRLRRLSGTDIPLATAILRGGMYREDNWAQTPSQALLAVSTVDQVGSRLLGRGYGVGDRMKPIHAGLVANDSLIILDEAHISAPFEETLTAIERFRSWAESGIPSPFRVVRMSATLSEEAEFSLRHVEDKHGVDARLAPRLEAKKCARLRLIKMETPPKRKDDRAAWRRFRQTRHARDEIFAEACVKATRELLASGGLRVGVVVSRVGCARRVFDALRQQDEADVKLLTGRIRPLDRDLVLDGVLPVLRPGSGERAARPLVLVATQCIEVGADLDFDALVTDCASLDALKQRFGRLDRIGHWGDSPAIVLARQDTVDKKAEADPIYGEALGETWRWLLEVASKPKSKSKRRRGDPVVDFGVRALMDKEGSLDPSMRQKLLAPRKQAPLLLPAYLDAWAQTNPRPAVEPEVGLWLHGGSERSADVQIVWRADLCDDNRHQWPEIVSLCPPASMEALPVPVYVARSWLEQASVVEVADVEAGAADEKEERAGTAGMARNRPFLRWRGDDSEVITDASGLRSGDTIVVPASYGGTDRFGWNPDASNTVDDLGDQAQWIQRGRALLRLHERVVGSWLPSGNGNGSAIERPQLPDAPDAHGPAESEHQEQVREFLSWVAHEEALRDWVREAAKELLDDPRRSLVAYPDGKGVVLRASRRVPQPHTFDVRPSEFTSEDDSSSFTTEVTLTRHCREVEKLARQFADCCGLRRELADDIALAGWLHDVGKVDPRFQVMLHGGDEIGAAMATEPLAKSGIRGRAERERARRAARYPRRERHEILSLAMIQHCEEVARRAHDLELVLHLVASHHGYCRPFAPPQSEEEVAVTLRHGDLMLVGSSPTGAARLDSGVPERFWRLLRRYGWFGLPYLEAILRLADHRQSENEEIGLPGPSGHDGEGR